MLIYLSRNINFIEKKSWILWFFLLLCVIMEIDFKKWSYLVKIICYFVIVLGIKFIGLGFIMLGIYFDLVIFNFMLCVKFFLGYKIIILM